VKPLVSVVIGAVIVAATMGYGALASTWVGGLNAVQAGALIGGISGGIMTGSLTGAVQGAIFGAISAGVAQAIGHAGGIFEAVRNYGGAIGKAALHGISRAGISKLQTGSGKGGFLSGFASSLLGGVVNGVQNASTAIKVTIAAIAGGTASAIGGGKFANGAMAGAFIMLFNDLAVQNTTAVNGEHRRIAVVGKDGKLKYAISLNFPGGVHSLNDFKNALLGKGIVEADMSKKAIKNFSYLETTNEQDKLMVSYLQNQVGQTHTYSILLYNCRTYANEQFNYMKKILGR
jgi:hypothetical protein